MKSKNTKLLGRHLDGRSTKALEKYAGYLLDLAKYTSTSFLLLLAFPFAKIFDLVVTNFDKHKTLSLFTLIDISNDMLPFILFWFFGLWLGQYLSVKLEKSALDIYDKISLDSNIGVKNEIM